MSQQAEAYNFGPTTEAAVTDAAPDCRELTLDQLDYATDLIAELREMSQRSGLRMLASLLALAQAEAAREVRSRRRQE